MQKDIFYRENRNMIKVYGMPSCPDCAEVEERIKASGKENDFTLVDIGKHVVYLKAFLQLRDRDEAFREAREQGYVGIPCFVREDGSVTLSYEDVGL